MFISCASVDSSLAVLRPAVMKEVACLWSKFWRVESSQWGRDDSRDRSRVRVASWAAVAWGVREAGISGVLREGF